LELQSKAEVIELQSEVIASHEKEISSLKTCIDTDFVKIANQNESAKHKPNNVHSNSNTHKGALNLNKENHIPNKKNGAQKQLKASQSLQEYDQSFFSEYSTAIFGEVKAGLNTIKSTFKK